MNDLLCFLSSNVSATYTVKSQGYRYSGVYFVKKGAQRAKWDEAKITFGSPKHRGGGAKDKQHPSAPTMSTGNVVGPPSATPSLAIQHVELRFSLIITYCTWPGLSCSVEAVGSQTGQPTDNHQMRGFDKWRPSEITMLFFVFLLFAEFFHSVFSYVYSVELRLA